MTSTRKWGLFVGLLVLQVLQDTNAASFVYRSGNQLMADGKPFYHLGFNAYWMPSSVAYGMSAGVDQVLDAAQSMGMKVVCTWGFNDKFPSQPGVYSEQQGKALDYVIAGAARRGMRVELALANLWPAYLGPEVWLTWAAGSAEGKTVADFYRSQKVLQLLEGHIQFVTSRVNTVTGVAYKNDPAIIGYNLFNEPRCPDCSVEDMAARNAFINSLAATLKSAAPNQLTFSGTEGFFAPGDSKVSYNPGAGAQCEGENWSAEISTFDVATTHMYYRQMERSASFGWKQPDFDTYIQYLNMKLQLYTDAAGRPLIVEEFGLSKRFFGLEESKVVLAVVADALIAAKRAGKSLMGEWLWQAAPPGEPDVGGYDACFRRPSGANIGLGGGGAASTTTNGNSSSSSASSSSKPTTTTTTTSSSSKAAVGRRLQHHQHQHHTRSLTEVVVKANEDVLDGFRRGSQRAACASRAAYTWSMAGIPKTVDVARYRAMVAGHDIVDVMAEAARLLSE